MSFTSFFSLPSYPDNMICIYRKIIAANLTLDLWQHSSKNMAKILRV